MWHMYMLDANTCPLRQRRHFYYLTGCDVPDCRFSYDIGIPPVDPEAVMWAGLPLQPKEAMEKYDVDAVLTTDELKSAKSVEQLLTKKGQTLLVMKDRADLSAFQADSVQHLQTKIDYDWLRRGIEQCRVVKDEHEIAMIRHANIVSSYAHKQVQASVLAASNERELNAVFVMHCHANGCKEMAYGCICAAGTNASTLHYVHNDLPLNTKLNMLLDAGSEYNCYCSDITRTFPLNGRFTKESREIYELVLKMQDECMGMIKAGVMWEDVHMHAHNIAAAGLRDLGILQKGLSVEQILDSKITTRFFPHGLGHYLGMDTHDTGGNANYEDPNPFLSYLRVRGKLPVNAVITNEPGIYFREFPLRQELKDGVWKGIVDESVLDRYWSVGGVRIEDDVVVKEDGCENLTTVSSNLDDIEGMCNGTIQV
jgi:Xaa-Pro dipeptidase